MLPGLYLIVPWAARWSASRSSAREAIYRFKINGVVLFSAVMLPSVAAANFQQTLSYFATQLDPASPSEVPARFPAVLVLNTFASGINESDAAALFQLVYHFAGAYFSWSGG